MLRPQLKNGMDSAWLLCQSLKETRVSKGIELIQLDFCLQSSKFLTDGIFETGAYGVPSKS